MKSISRTLAVLKVHQFRIELMVLCAAAALFGSGCNSKPNGLAPENHPLSLQLTATNQQAFHACERVIAHPETVNAVNLYFAARIALNSQRAEDAGFLFFAARFRGAFDRAVFPPLEPDSGNDPAVLLGALRQSLGSAINPVVMRNPEVLGRIVNRLKNWNPRVTADYNPGWEYVTVRSPVDGHEATREPLISLIKSFEGPVALLHNAEYSAALRELEVPQGSDAGAQERRNRAQAALETIRRIEREMGIDGFGSMIQ